jgi:asparagine synthase (glutamine-hydrolysing)
MTPTEHLCLGQPRFQADALTAIATQEGNLAAWLKAFTLHGTQAPNTVSGDFAVAIETHDGRTFLAVDRFAIQTLCYRIVDSKLYFAPRADALADAVPALDPQAIFEYLYFHFIPSPRTIYKDVYRLPPGHYALFDNGQLTVAPYWQPAFKEARRESFSQLRLEFRLILRDAIVTQLDRGDIGCYLSGGTDSSTVAGMVTALTEQPAETYSIGFDAKGYDEMEYARIASRHFKTRHHEYYVTPDDLVRSMADVAAHYDQPFGNSSAVPAFYCARMAREDGVHKMLAGDGGDELFGGNTRYAKQRVFGAYSTLPGFVRKGLVEPLVDSRIFDPIPLLKKGASYVRQSRVPMPERLESYNLLMRLGLQDVLTEGFLARVDPLGPERQQREVYAACPAGSPVNRHLAFDWRYTLAENDLPKVIGSAQLAGVMVGFPLLDDRLLEFSLKLPSAYKVRGLKLRWFFKEALRSFLPAEIIKKKKHGFGLPFGVWANTHAPLKKLTADALHGLADRGIVRREFIDALLDTHLPAHPGFYGELVWILTMLELWLQAHAPDYRGN